MWLVEALGYKLKKPKKNWLNSFGSRHLPGSHMFFLPVPSSNNKLWPFSDPVSPQHRKIQKNRTSVVSSHFPCAFAPIGRRLTKKGILVRSPAFLILDVEIIGGVRRQDKGCLVFVGWVEAAVVLFIPTKGAKIGWLFVTCKHLNKLPGTRHPNCGFWS